MVTYAPARNGDNPLYMTPELVDEDDYDSFSSRGSSSKQFRNPLYDYQDVVLMAAANYESGMKLH